MALLLVVPSVGKKRCRRMWQELTVSKFLVDESKMVKKQYGLRKIVGNILGKIY